MWATYPLFSLLFAGIISADDPGARLIRSSIVCENDIWKRECPGESVLSIEAVDYKVVTVSYICSRNNSVLGTPCPSPVSKTSVVKNTCNGKKQCSLSAEKSIFGEPCPETKSTASIYLEIFYACVDPPTPSPTSPTTPELLESSSREPTSKPEVRATMVSKTPSPSSTANPVYVNTSPERLSGQMTTTKYRKPRPCTTSPKRHVITFNPNNEADAMNEGSSLFFSPQNAQVVFLSALLLAAIQVLLYE